MIFNTIQYFNSQHLNHYLIQLARQSTAEFIVKNMSKVKSFDGDGAGEILKFSVEKSINEGLFLEFGVASGRTVNIISEIRPNQILVIGLLNAQSSCLMNILIILHGKSENIKRLMNLFLITKSNLNTLLIIIMNKLQ